MFSRLTSLLSLGLPAVFLLAGCYSMDISSNKAISHPSSSSNEVARAEHVVVSNYGWYLFNAIPLACGNADRDAKFPWKFFRNHVTSSLLHDRMMEYARKQGADVGELTFFRDEQVFFSIPGSQFPVPIPYVLCFREIQFSGVLTKRETEVRR